MATNSHLSSHAPFDLVICLVCHVANVINYANFLKISAKVSGL